jgi:hypothetical protein
MVHRPALQSTLVVVGVALVVLSAIPIGGGVRDVDYVHRIEPATDGTLAYGIEYDEDDIMAYESLSERGQRVVARGVDDSPYVVETESATAPAFEYTSDHVALGQGLYAVRYEGATCSVETTRRSGGLNVAELVVGIVLSAARPVGLVLLVVGVLLAGLRRYGSN